MSSEAKALAGVVVADFTQQLSGPFCSMILADLGAEVIKIEKPAGDDTRTSPPFLNGESTYYMSVNRGKKSVVLDLKNLEHVAVAKELAAKADVVLENARPGVMDRLGLGYETIREANPKVIYASISGFGQNGPYRSRGGLDVVIQAMSGLMSITGEKGGRPVKAGSSISDVVAGCYAALGVMAALNHRHVSGEGQYVDISMFDATVSILENAIARYCANGVVPRPSGNRHTATAPFQPFETADGEIIVCVINNKLWESFCEVLGLQHLIKDERFLATAQRVANVDELAALITEVTRTRTTADLAAAFEKDGVPFGEVNTIDKVLTDPQLAVREMIVEVQHPVAGPFKMTGSPLKLSRTPADAHRPSPVLGADTEEVLRRHLGKTEDEIASLTGKIAFV